MSPSLIQRLKHQRFIKMGAVMSSDGAQLHRPAHLGMFYLELGHLYEVLPEGHDTPAFETGEFYEDDIGS